MTVCDFPGKNTVVIYYAYESRDLNNNRSIKMPSILASH